VLLLFFVVSTFEQHGLKAHPTVRKICEDPSALLRTESAFICG
jgi:hypothetical protein